MLVNDTYKSVEGPSEGSFRDKGSRFLAFLYPVESEEEVKLKVDALKKEYHDARHHCYAYRLGLDGERFRANDDGEPSGSAARQILGQIDSAGLSDVLVVVVRYFGGIKLGIPGLIRAYRTAAAEAIAAAHMTDKVASGIYTLRFPYESMQAVMKTVKDLELPQSGQDFGTECTMKVAVRLSKIEDFLEKTKNMNIFIDTNSDI